tara:strand:+ start:2372 stop:2632 length:261 start_codon:yes stop_codon:yes gene_type:complete
MKIFLIKSIVIFIGLFLLFQITIGSVINNFQQELENQISNEKIILMKDKVREEMKKGIEKDRILNPDDAQLLGKFLNKLLKEINQN